MTDGREIYIGPSGQGRRGSGAILGRGNPGKGVTIVGTAIPVVAGSPVSDAIFSADLPAQGRTVLNVSGDDDQSRVISISMFINDVPSPTVGALTLARAALEFGSGGARSRVLIDYLNGTSFSLCAASIRINVIRDPAIGLSAGIGNPFEGLYQAVAAYGAIAANSHQPQLTITQIEATAGSGVFPLIPGGIARFTIPDFAESVQILVFPNEPFQVNIGGVTLGYEVSYGVGGVADPPRELWLPNWARAIDVTNQGVNNISSMNLVFKLSL